MPQEARLMFLCHRIYFGSMCQRNSSAISWRDWMLLKRIRKRAHCSRIMHSFDELINDGFWQNKVQTLARTAVGIRSGVLDTETRECRWHRNQMKCFCNASRPSLCSRSSHSQRTNWKIYHALQMLWHTMPKYKSQSTRAYALCNRDECVTLSSSHTCTP